MGQESARRQAALCHGGPHARLHAYGKMFENAAERRAGNVDKCGVEQALQRRRREHGLRRGSSRKDGSADWRASFIWINKIVSQTPCRPSSPGRQRVLTRARRRAKTRPLQQMIHRNIAKVMLKIIPDRESFVPCTARRTQSWHRRCCGSKLEEQSGAVDEFFKRTRSPPRRGGQHPATAAHRLPRREAAAALPARAAAQGG